MAGDVFLCDRFLIQWRKLCVFLLPAFTRPRHERQDRLSPSDGIHVCTDRGLYCHPKEFPGIESEPMLTPREKSPLPEALRGSNP